MTPGPRLRRVPNQPKTPNRTIRVPSELWFRAKEIAKDRGENITDVIIRALTRYVRTYGNHED
jgi:hypothetical protein